jgi:hypothetical protein
MTSKENLVPDSSNNTDVAIKIDEPQQERDFPNIKIYDSIEEFNANLPETVTLLRMPNKCNVYLVGTAHFSEKSSEDVANVIRNVRPKTVLVEVGQHVLTEILINLILF